MLNTEIVTTATASGKSRKKVATVETLLSKAFADGGEIVEASARFFDLLMEHEAVRSDIEDEAFKIYADYTVRLFVQKNRVAIDRTSRKSASEILPYAETTRGKEAIVAGKIADDRLRRHAENLLMNWPLPGGKLLRDATRIDMVEAERFYGTRAITYGHRAHWCRSIIQALPNDKATVGQTLNEVEILRMEEISRVAQ